MKQFTKKLKIAVITASMIIGGAGVMSLNTTTPLYAATSNCSGATLIFTIPSWYQGLCDSSSGTLKSPKDLASGTDTTGVRAYLMTIALNIVAILLYVVGYVSLGFIIWGGFKYMINGDNQGGVAAAKKTILNAVIGLILSIMAVAIVRFVTEAIV